MAPLLPEMPSRGEAPVTEAERIEQLERTLDEIGRAAKSCWMDRQGRLVDGEHRRAHAVLEAIAKTAAAVLPGRSE